MTRSDPWLCMQLERQLAITTPSNGTTSAAVVPLHADAERETVEASEA